MKPGSYGMKRLALAILMYFWSLENLHHSWRSRAKSNSLEAPICNLGDEGGQEQEGEEAGNSNKDTVAVEDSLAMAEVERLSPSQVFRLSSVEVNQHEPS